MTALRKLLVVDDDPVVGASFNRVLSGKGYVVVSAENGHEALAKLQAEKFDAVFTDLRMPGMDGLQVAERVRAAQPWTPVVIVTGYGSPSSEARARAAGVSAFIHKPLSPEMIEDSADQAVRTVVGTAPRTEPAPLAAAIEPVAEAPAVAAAPRSRVLRTLRNMALFLAAPFIGLVYAVLLPFVGAGMMLWVATEGLRRKRAAAAEAAVPVAQAPVAAAPAIEPSPVEAHGAEATAAETGGAAKAAKLVLGLLAAPFIGLAWIVVAPIAGLVALAWIAMKAAFVREAS